MQPFPEIKRHLDIKYHSDENNEARCDFYFSAG